VEFKIREERRYSDLDVEVGELDHTGHDLLGAGERGEKLERWEKRKQLDQYERWVQ
jgi:hypothetical protein